MIELDTAQLAIDRENRKRARLAVELEETVVQNTLLKIYLSIATVVATVAVILLLARSTPWN